MPRTNKDQNLLEMMGTLVPDEYTHTIRESFMETTIEALLVLAEIHPNNFHSSQIRNAHQHTPIGEKIVITTAMFEAMRDNKLTYIHKFFDHKRKELCYQTRVIEYLSPPENGTTPSPETLNGE